jgi:competence protein ComEA
MRFVRTLFLALGLLASGLAWAVPVDINSADAKTLQTLEGVGPAKATAIVEYRQANGPFKSLEELGKVKGVGDRIIEANRANIVLGKAAAPAKASVSKQ